MKYHYRVNDSTYIYCCLVPTWRATYDNITKQHDQEAIAEECADDYFHNHDGWDDKNWVNGQEQIIITLVYEKQDVRSFNVSVECEPRFNVQPLRLIKR